MKKLLNQMLLLFLIVGLLASCQSNPGDDDEHYLQVIGEHEQPTPDGGYRLNLSFNGPMSMRKKFDKWADSLQKVMPGMVKMNDNIFLNYMPEQMGKKMSADMYQVGVGYNLQVADTATYNQIAESLLKHNIPFNLNMTGSYIEPAQKVAVQKEMLQKALDNAKAKLDFLKGDSSRIYEIVSIEEMDSQLPYGPEYYDYNRRMAVRVKVKARLN